VYSLLSIVQLSLNDRPKILRATFISVNYSSVNSYDRPSWIDDIFAFNLTLSI